MGVIKRIRRDTTTNTNTKNNTQATTAKVINNTTSKSTGATAAKSTTSTTAKNTTTTNKTIARRGNTTTVKTNNNKNKTSTSRDKWKHEEKEEKSAEERYDEAVEKWQSDNSSDKKETTIGKVNSSGQSGMSKMLSDNPLGGGTSKDQDKGGGLSVVAPGKRNRTGTYNTPLEYSNRKANGTGGSLLGFLRGEDKGIYESTLPEATRGSSNNWLNNVNSGLWDSQDDSSLWSRKRLQKTIDEITKQEEATEAKRRTGAVLPDNPLGNLLIPQDALIPENNGYDTSAGYINSRANKFIQSLAEGNVLTLDGTGRETSMPLYSRTGYDGDRSQVAHDLYRYMYGVNAYDRELRENGDDLSPESKQQMLNILTMDQGEREAEENRQMQENYQWNLNIDRTMDALGQMKAGYQGLYDAQDAYFGSLETANQRKNDNNYIDRYGRGNIDLYNRQKYIGEDGSVGTVNSMSFYDEDERKEILIPTIIDGKQVSEDEAIDHYYETGEYLGKFDTPEEANEYGQLLHEQQERLYSDQTKETQQELYEIYSFLTGGEVWENKIGETILNQMGGGRPDLSPIFESYDYAYYMPDAAVDAFIDAYANGDYESCMALLEGTKAVRENANAGQHKNWLTYISDEAPITSFAASTMGNFAGSVTGIPVAIANLAGADPKETEKFLRTSEYSSYIRQNLASNANSEVTRLTGSETLGNMAAEGVGVLGSIADNTLRQATAGLFAELGAASSAAQYADRMKTISLGIMGLNVFTNDYAQQLEETGGDTTYATMHAMMSGLLELSTETVLSADALFNTDTYGFEYFKNVVLGEAAEEMTGAVLDPVTESALNQFYYGYIRKEGKQPSVWDQNATDLYINNPEKYTDEQGNVDWKAAKRDAMMDYGMDILKSTITGGLAAVPDAAVVSYQTTGQFKRTGKQIVDNEQTQPLADMAVGMKNSPEAQKYGEEIKRKLESGKKLNNKEIGRLYEMVVQGTNDEMSQTVSDTLNRNVKNYLQETYGDRMNAETQTAISRIITKATTEGVESLNFRERSMMKNWPAAQDLMNDLTSGQKVDNAKRSAEMMQTTKAEIKQNTASLAEQNKQLQDMVKYDPTKLMEGTKAAAKQAAKLAEERAKISVEQAEVKMASAEEIEALGITGTETETDTETGAEPEGVNKTGSSGRVVRRIQPRQAIVYETSDGEGGTETKAGSLIRKQGNQYIIETEDGTEMAVDAAGARAADEVTAAAMNFVEVSGMDDTTATAVLETAQSEKATPQNVTEMLQSATDMFTRGAVDRIMGTADALNAATKDMKMDPSLAEELYRKGSQAAQEAEDTRKAKAQEKGSILNPGQGKVTYNNVDTESLNGSQQKQMNAIAAIMQKIGMNVTFENDSQNKNRFGEYDPSTDSVIINVAGMHRNGDTHHMMVTAGHELTHVLEHNSPEAYAQLRDFIFKEMARNGADIATRIQQKMDNNNRQIADMRRNLVKDLMKQEGLTEEQANERARKRYNETTVSEVIAEVVADASDQVLSNEKLINQLANDNPNLFQKVQNFVRDFVNKVKSAIGGMRQSGSIDSLYIKDLDGLAEKWGIALQEVQGKTGEKVQLGETTIQFSVDEEGRTLKKQIRDAAETLNGMNAVRSVSTGIDLTPYYNKGAQTKEAAVKMWAKDTADAFGRDVTRDGFGTARISNAAISRIFSYLATRNDAYVAAFQAIPDVVQHGIEIDSHENHKGRHIDSYTYAAPVEIDGVRGNMGVIMRTTEGENSLKTYKVLLPDGTEVVIENEKAEAGNRHQSFEESEGEHPTASADKANVAETDRNGNSQSGQNPITDIIDSVKPKGSFSLDNVLEQTEEGLIAVHNLSAQSLLSDIRMGGFPMPSIAVVRQSKGWNDYGDISVIFDRYTVDPQLNPNARLYGGDAYTPTLGSFDAQGSAQNALEYLRSKPERGYGNIRGISVSNFQQLASVDQAREMSSEARRANATEAFKANIEALHGIQDLLKSRMGNQSWAERRAYAEAENVLNQATLNVLDEFNRGRAAEELVVNPDTLPGMFNDAMNQVIEQRESRGTIGDRTEFFTAEDADALQNYLETIAGRYSDMQEAKPNEVVGFEHAKAIIIPEDAEMFLADALEQLGVPYYTYADGNIIDRKNKLNGFVAEYQRTERAPGESVRFSMAEMDNEYMQAAASGDEAKARELMERAAEVQMKDSKIRTKDGKLRKVYHGTYSDKFTVFDKNLIGTAREGDTGFFGRGFYFAYSQGEAATYGRNVMDAYLDIRNPYNFETNLNTYNGEKTHSWNAGKAVFAVNWANQFPEMAGSQTIGIARSGDDNIEYIPMTEFAGEFEKVYQEKRFEVEEMDSQGERVWYVQADPTEESFTDRDGVEHKWKEYGFQRKYYNAEDANDRLNQVYEYLQSEVYSYIDIPSSAAIVMESNLTEALKGRGYDGVIQSEDGDEIVAFESEQIKSADPITYDDDGNVIPLSERFNQESKDIRFSLAETNDGEQYVVIDTDQTYFDNIEPRNMPKAVARYITARFRGTIIGEGENRAYVSRESANEYARPAKRNLPTDIYETKARASTELDNLMKASSFIEHRENAAGRHSENTGGWDIYRVTIYNPTDGQYYQGDINIEYVAKGRLFYDMTNITNVTESMQGRNAQRKQRSRSGNIIQYSSENDNSQSGQTQYSFDDATPDANDWLMGIDPKDLTGDSVEFFNTKGTREMIRNYQSLNREIQEVTQNIANMQQQAKEAKGDELRKLRINIQTEKNKLNRLQSRMNEITGRKDFGWLMQRAQQTIDTFLRGKTQAEVEKNVEKMKRDADKLRETAAQAAEDLEKLADREDAAIAGRMLNQDQLQKAAAKIKAENNNHGDIQMIMDGLGNVVVKMMSGDGSGTQQAIEDLTNNLINADWATYRFGMYGGKYFKAEDVEGDVRDLIMDRIIGSVSSLIPAGGDTGTAKTEIESLIKYVNDTTKNTRQTARGMRRMEEFAKAMQERGDNIARATQEMRSELQRAVKYFDMVAEKNRAEVSAAQIEEITRTLESKAAKRVLEEQNKWAQRMEKDKQLRELSQENQKTRRKINTAYNRVTKLILAETDQKNVLENMKGIARAAIRMIMENDANGRKKITAVDWQTLQRSWQTLQAIDKRDGTDLNIESITDMYGERDEDLQDAIREALNDIRTGIDFYSGSGKGRTQHTLEGDKQALSQIQKGMSQIYDIVHTAGQVFIEGRKVDTANVAYEVDTEARKKEAYREWVGGMGKLVNGMNRSIVMGNMTPEYFFKNMKNNGISMLYNEFKTAEDRYGKLIREAKDKVAEAAEQNGYGKWDTEAKHEITLASGKKINLTMEQMMSLYATWKREQTLGPEMSQHLEKGGFVFEEKSNKKFIGREARAQKPVRVTAGDIQTVENMLTAEQKSYVDAMVKILSEDMSKIGNEASMRMFGIEKYKETYYFPFSVWDGVKNKASNSGSSVNPTNNNRAAHQGFTNRRKANASNAILLRDFTKVCAEHINQMATYATMGGAIENMNRVLNFRVLETEDGYQNATERNVESLLTEKYGRHMTDYLRQFMKDLNGGTVQENGGFSSSLMSLFKKNAVGGSLSVALQQPLSYIRASTMIDVKYLTMAGAAVDARMPGSVTGGLIKGVTKKDNSLTKYWNNSYNEMMEHSGVAVIKDMGRFDMNFSQGAVEWIMPETTERGIRKVYDAIESATNALPEKMDQYTWVKMWTALKMEQHDLHPEMSITSDEFLDMVGERFNDVMRKTQVYDSVLVKSQMMRNQGWMAKTLTAFRAEPTLSLNLFMDAMANWKEKGGKKNMAAVLATFLISAIAQAAIKGIMTSGRNPDEKKTLAENFAYRAGSNFISEANPLQLIPGYDNIMDALSGNDINDNAWGMIKTFSKSLQKIWNPPTGENWTAESGYRYIEDTIGQLTQMFSGIPAKNLMRDSRAVYNWFGGTYADRDHPGEDEKGNPITIKARATSGNVLKYQAIDTVMAEDLIGLINNTLLQGKAWDSSTGAYYNRIYQAEKSGDDQTADDMREYLTQGLGKTEKTVKSGVASAIKKDESITSAEKADYLLEHGYADKTSYITSEFKEGNITEQEMVDLYKKYFPDKNPSSIIKSFWMNEYKEGEISRAEAEKKYKQYYPDATADDIWWAFDKIDFQVETGKSASGDYYRMNAAIEGNKSAEINAAVNLVMKHGKKKSGVLSSLKSNWADKYLAMRDGSPEKVRLKDAMIKALKAAGYSATQAEREIDKWKKETKTKK